MRFVSVCYVRMPSVKQQIQNPAHLRQRGGRKGSEFTGKQQQRLRAQAQEGPSSGAARWVWGQELLHPFLRARALRRMPSSLVRSLCGSISVLETQHLTGQTQITYLPLPWRKGSSPPCNPGRYKQQIIPVTCHRMCSPTLVPYSGMTFKASLWSLPDRSSHLPPRQETCHAHLCWDLLGDP